MSDPASTNNAEFIKAAEDVKNLPNKPSNVELLALYAHFKQGINGDNTTAQPHMFDLQAKAKWTAWTNLKGTTKEAAQAKYIELVKELQQK
ncbi:acyl-CoA-binding protein [Polychytrium aggregatum]|uniref:acyl-CoA-binding protein n=1 Tax=Polychytrium aggregatum TaxID=110093 RepID=UPI0022FDBD75|nr:acyl-CoA-binding protein [Polychytrium aggregatum]KAI9203667.1 acyl-CoA-binding protein [Polychytrium aggregatum]